MLQVCVTQHQDYVKELIKSNYPELIFKSQSRVGIVYETTDDNKYLPLLKNIIKNDKKFAGLFTAVIKF